MKKCAIIGSKGYIGSHLNWFLQQHGIIPMCYDVIECNEFYYKQVDLTNTKDINKIDLDVDLIFYFVGLTGTYAGFDHYEKYISINEIALLNFLTAIKNSQHRPKIIFPSTRLIYKGRDKPLKENDTKETKTIYAVNKLACEGLLQAYKASFDIPYTIFRICIPYGNLLSKDYSFGTVGFFINKASAGLPISLYGGGNTKRTFTHMKDLCHQITTVSFMDESNGEIYNVGGETLLLKDAAAIIADKYKTTVVSTPWPERDLRIESGDTYFDDSKIVSLIGSVEYKKLKDFRNEL